jgi:hypothetical protein
MREEEMLMKRKWIIATTMATATLALGCASYLQMTRADATQETGPDPFDFPIADHVDFRANHQTGHGRANFAWYDADYTATHRTDTPATIEPIHLAALTNHEQSPGVPHAHDGDDHTPAGAGGGGFDGGTNRVAGLPHGGGAGDGAGEDAGWGPGGGFYAPPASGGGRGRPAGNSPAANTPANTAGAGPGNNNPPHDSAPTDTGSAGPGSNQPASGEPPPSNHDDGTLHTGDTHEGGDNQHHGDDGTPNPPYSTDPLPTDPTADLTSPNDPPPNEVHSVPEPGTLGLLALSLASAAALRRRRRAT